MHANARSSPNHRTFSAYDSIYVQHTVASAAPAASGVDVWPDYDAAECILKAEEEKKPSHIKIKTRKTYRQILIPMCTDIGGSLNPLHGTLK